MRLRAPVAVVLASGFVAAAISVAAARELEFEFPVPVPTIEGLDADVTVADGDVPVRLSLAYDERGRIVAQGPCTLDGAAAQVSGRVRGSGAARSYRIVVRAADGMRVTLAGALRPGDGTATAQVRGPRGRARGDAAATLRGTDAALARVSLVLDEDADGLLLGRRGALSGSGSIASPFGNAASGLVPVEGSLRNGRLSFALRSGRARVAFKGAASGDGFVGKLTFSLPPAAGSSDGFSVAGVPGGGGAGDGSTKAVLQALGVDTQATPRADGRGGDLPDEFAPLGATATLNRTDEIWLGLFGDGGYTPALSLRGFDVNGNVATIATPAPAAYPWLAANAVAALASADVDGDGHDETLAFHLAGPNLAVSVFDDAQSGFAETTYALGAVSGVRRLCAADGDFDGDGVSEVALGICRADDAEIRFYGWSAGAIRQVSATTPTFARSLAGAELSLVMRAGNLDFDRADELAIVLNELDDTTPTGRSRWFLHDDANAEYAALAGADVQGFDGIVRTALVSGMDLGDVDGDGLDEVLLGGYTHLAGGGSTDLQPMLTVAFDDAAHGLDPLGARWRQSGSWIKSPSNSPWRIRFVHVNAADLDGDGAYEVHANQFVFEDFRSHAPWTDFAEIPYDEFFRDLSDDGARFRQDTTQMVAADVLGDGRDAIVMYIPWKSRVSVFGIDPLTGWKRRATFPMPISAPASGHRVALLPANVDEDSPVLRYDEATYELVFTEPVVLAAMAAPPTWADRGQNLGASSTTFGTATTVGVDAELVFSVRSGSIVGSEFEVPLIGVGAEVEKTVQAEVSVFAGAGYELEEAVFYKGGATEDSVVFTSVPYDVWTYTIVSHPDPAAVGGKVTVALPRPPVTRKVSRDFYNQHVPAGAQRVDASVFSHTIGDPESYSTPAERDQILGPLGVFGLRSARRSVGQGTGSLGVSLVVSTEVSVGGSLELSYDVRANTTGAVKLGMSVGASASASLRVRSGASTTYAAEIGDLPAATFAASSYDWGLFTYVFRGGSQQFQVLDYWTENFAR